MSEVIGHALDAQDVERAADLVEQAAINVLMRSEMATVSNWLKALPEAVLFSRPRLCGLSAGVMAFTGQMQAVEPLLQKAESQAPLDAQDPDSRDLLGQVRLIRAFRLVFEGDLPGAGRLARESLEYLPEGDSMARRVIEWAGRELGSLNGRAFRERLIETTKVLLNSSAAVTLWAG
jgi:LuxR family maltose regulon positive regulatory protein